MVEQMMIFADGTSRTFQSRSGSVTGLYSSLINVIPSLVNSEKNIWLHALSEKGCDDMMLMNAFVKDAISLFDPFPLYNAHYSNALGDPTYTTHCVRLRNTLFDGKDRFHFSSIYGSRSYRGNCANCEVSIENMYLDIEELEVLQEEIERKLEQDDSRSFDDMINKEKENVYVLRSLDRRNELLAISSVFRPESKRKKFLKLAGGYKLEFNPFLDNNLDVFEMNICERYHLLYHSCGTVRLEAMKIIALVISAKKDQELHTRIRTVFNTPVNLEKIEEYDFQFFEKFSKTLAICLTGLVPSEIEEHFKITVAIGHILQLPYVNPGMISILEQLYKSNRQSGMKLFPDIFTRQKSHELGHAIQDKRTTGLFIDCQCREKYHLEVKRQYGKYNSTYYVLKQLYMKQYLTYLRLRLDEGYLNTVVEKGRSFVQVFNVQNDCYVNFKLVLKKDTIRSIQGTNGEKYFSLGDYLFYGDSLENVGSIQSFVHESNHIVIHGNRCVIDPKISMYGCPTVVTSGDYYVANILSCAPAAVVYVDNQAYLKTFTDYNRFSLKRDTHFNLCFMCNSGGDLRMCDGCPLVCHEYCHPENAFELRKSWYCGLCSL